MCVVRAAELTRVDVVDVLGRSAAVDAGVHVGVEHVRERDAPEVVVVAVAAVDAEAIGVTPVGAERVQLQRALARAATLGAVWAQLGAPGNDLGVGAGGVTGAVGAGDGAVLDRVGGTACAGGSAVTL